MARSVASWRRPGRPRLAALRGALAVIAAILAGPAAIAAAPSTCDTADVVAHALSAVVNISVVRVLRKANPAPGKPPDEHFEVFVGSGVIIDPTGIIVTNKHVIKDGAMILVTFQDRSQVPAQLIDAAELVDLALLKVTVPKPLPTLSFANSDAVRVGQPVIAVGNPLGLGTSVSTGVVSALNRDLMSSPFDDFIQTDASINPGNSGGPLLNCAGKIVGIDSDLVSNNPLLSSIGLGFAMPSNDVSFVAGKLRNPGYVMPDWIGLHLQDLTAQLATVFGRPDVAGAIVTSVDADSPAARASLAQGDIITAVRGQAMPDSRAILRTVVVAPEGAAITLSVWRHGQMRDVTVRTVPWPRMLALRSQVLASPQAIARAESVGLGLHLTRISAADRRRYSLADTSGVLIDRVVSGSQAEDMNLRAGDVIEQVGARRATTPAEVTARLTPSRTAPGNLVALLVRGKSGLRWTTLWLGRIDPKDLVAGPVAPEASGETHDVAGRPR
ncbi:MAG TPA: trypsin-like peptidase domain-containing protein [Acetobacteraceae bacterium]|nr:trypsin-like peptidase domain-containing protein [Acetobacteraceae bacterium]